MTHLLRSVLCSAVLGLFCTQVMANDSHASQASHHGSQASKYSALSVGESAVVGAQVSMVMLAAPIAVVGISAMSAGAVSTSAALSLSDAASPKPLPICDDVLIAGPAPAQALSEER
ncbi:hypothetical protein [Pseudoalteromonas ardens]|uniref:Uncharacterized protein n=1 Tax=Pseudoalteromonas rubra TaxID=43658 RepID=A0A0L0ENG7_9GAMM|nr:hypothetical protein [Pseudoalteromonas sp. R96]KNC65443.1 hypothetical protein AC626_23045 [Pseudoalteromonas rubra]MDK1310547.1 hypothetical protein [Pseudoalteromonas sp. R96]